MAELKWELIYETGNEDIDQQHRYLVHLINRIQDELKIEMITEDVMRLFKELLYYARFHFISEENIMRKFDYPELDAHTLHHEKLLETFEERMEAFHEGREDIETIMDFVTDWFSLHTRNDDKKFAHYLETSNVA